MRLFGKEGYPGLVVRPQAPMRRVLSITLAVLAVVGLYLAFELGRYLAGYDVVSVLLERARLHSSIAHLRAANRSLQARVIGLETVDAGHAREDQVVARTIGDLQAQVARQTEELGFYRAVVAQGAPAIGVRVGTVRLSSAKPAGHFVVHVSLVRAGTPDGMASGSVTLTVDGQGPSGKVATLGEQALTGSSADLAYDFRYYQELQENMALPPDFHPEHLTVQVGSSRKDVAPLTQTFPWSAVAAP